MSRKKKGDPVHGWINLDKPYGMTSTQAVGKVRRLLNAQKVGHAGTLDPLATGILPIALGEATKTIPFMQDRMKIYEFTVGWGEQRDTDDSEGEVIATSGHRPDEAAIKALLPRYTGEIAQIPPLYSAIKVQGQRAYDLARAGEIPELKARTVYIEELTILSCHPDRSGREVEGSKKDSSTTDLRSSTRNDAIEETAFRMLCGKGTYVRSLARDMAMDLGTRGYIKALRRTAVGPFTAEGAILLDKLEQMDYVAARTEALLPLQSVLDDIPALPLKEQEVARLRNGQTLAFVSRPDFMRLTREGLGGKDCVEALALYGGEPVALVEAEGAEIHPVRVFNM